MMMMMVAAAAATGGLLLLLLLLAWRRRRGVPVACCWAAHAWAADVAFLLRAWRCRHRLLAGDGRSLAQRFGALAAAQPPGKVFLRAGERSFTYAQAERESNRAGRALWAALQEEESQRRSRGWAPPRGAAAGPAAPRCGAGRGGVVALLVGNRPAFVWAWIGLAKLGVVPAFLGTALRRGALAHCLRACEAQAILVADDLFEAVDPILPSLKDMGITVWVLGKGDYPPGVIRIDPLLEEASDEPLPSEFSTPKSLLDTCLYIFTSGTTGLPKAARISHIKAILCLGFYDLVGASSSDVIYVSLPLYHMAGSLLGIIGTMGIGATCVLKQKFSASQFWPDCRHYGVTIFQYIGELCRYLVNQPPSPEDRKHGLRMAVGSGLRPDVWREFLRRFGDIRVVETYGQTEGSVSLFNYTGTIGALGRGSWLYKLFSPFELIRYDVLQEAPIKDEAGRCLRVGPDEPGLLVVPVTQQKPFHGYAGDQKLSEAKLLHGVFADGDIYLNTGDLMVQNAQGFVSFWDRIGDTFRWKGENVSTTEVGEILGALESLQEVTVYGVTVPGHEGRAGMASIVLQPGREFDGDQLYAHITEFLAPYARPQFLRIQDHLEVTETFKQQKVRLAAEGFDPTQILNPLFFLDNATKTYAPLTVRVWERIVAGEIRL